MWECSECNLLNKLTQKQCQACFTSYDDRNPIKGREDNNRNNNNKNNNNNNNDNDNINDNNNNNDDDININNDDDKLKIKAKNLGDILISDKHTIAEKMKTCFLLKQLNTNEAIDALNRGFKSDSALLKHEIAYVMGQMRNDYAIPYLKAILYDKDNQESITRHEAAEALAAIARYDNNNDNNNNNNNNNDNNNNNNSNYHLIRSMLKQFTNDSSVEVAETCKLALDSLDWASQNKQEIKLSQSNSIDPAPSMNVDKIKGEEKYLNEEELEKIYLNKNESLFKRYRAMFGLRDINNEKSVEILCKGFNDNSSLFKHEIAFVLGQMMNKHAIPYLKNVLSIQNEHCMVRHECAEALGSIAQNDSILSYLKQYLQDKEQVVSESCQVALDMYEYWNNDEIDNVYYD